MKKEFVFETPAPFQECHASTLVELADGRIMAAWFGGTREGGRDVAIWGAVRSSGGWQAPRCLVKMNDQPHWNPVLFRGKGTRVSLFFKIGPNCHHWRTMAMVSDDNGKTWSEPRETVAGNRGGRGPVKNKCILLSDGAWLAPASSEIGWWQAFCDRSTDEGKTWQCTKLIPMERTILGKNDKGEEIRFGVIQPTLWESSPGQVHMLLRASCGQICRSDSTDGGRTWRRVYRTELPNNNSGIDLAKLADGKLLLAHNPVGKNWGPRWPMRLSLSADNGATWTILDDTDTEENREYSYPAVVSTRDGGAAVTYTWGRKNIAFVTLKPSELK